MNAMIPEVYDCKLYCEPFGDMFEYGLKLRSIGYGGRINCNNIHRSVHTFWNSLHSQREELLSKIDIIRNGMVERGETEEAYSYLWNKIRSKRGIHNGAAYYISIMGVNTRDYDEDKINELREKTKGVEFERNEYVKYIEVHDAYDTFFYMNPSINIDITDEKFKEMLRNIKGVWVLSVPYTPKVLKELSEFNIIYSYNDRKDGGIRIDVRIQNV